jgi:periplasmic protein TonB
MRTAFANVLSAGIHVVGIGGLALLSMDQDWLHFQVAAGRPMVIEFAAAASQAQPESQPVRLEIAPAPSPIEAPNEAPDPEAASVAVGRQLPLVEIAEEVASAEAPPADAPPLAKAQTTPAELPPPEPAAAPPQRLPPRTPTRDPPEFQTAALSAPAVIEVGAVDSFPRKLPHNPAPPYPQDAWLARIQGRVVLRVLVEPSGQVSSVLVHASSGSASLDDSALMTVRTWRFEPARRRGAAVSHEVLVPVRFTIVPN